MIVDFEQETSYNYSMNRCKTCKHWMRKTGDDEQIASIAPDGPTWSPSWMERVCKMMCYNGGVTITTSCGMWDSGSKVDSVETDANFGCVFHEQ